MKKGVGPKIQCPIMDTLYGVTDGSGSDQHYTINTTTGAATLIGDRMGGNLTGLGELGSQGDDVPASSSLGLFVLLAILMTVSWDILKRKGGARHPA